MNGGNDKYFLNSLDGIRALATIGIFLFHSGFLLNGTFPVTLFFMLSGFMMYYTKSNNIPDTWKEWNQTYVFKNLKSYYWIHVLTFFAACIIGNVWNKPIKESFIAAVLNLLLINPFFEKYALVYNGLSWYLCITIFLYILSWPLMIIITKVKRSLWAVFCTLMLIEILNFLQHYG